jgi:DNA repair protein RadC
MSMETKIRETSFYHLKIKDWPEDERPREKLLKSGPQALSDAELVALLVGSGTGGVTAVDVAIKLIQEHNGLAALASKGVSELVRMKGIGKARGARILAAFEIGRRTASGTGEKAQKVHSPEDVAKILGPHLRDARHEVFKVILLDGGNRMIRECTVSQGTLNASLVHPREVFKAAVDHLAASVILAHNHPSGEPEPSAEDRSITVRMADAGKLMGIPVLDHVIIARNGHFSFAREGLIKP